MDALGRGLLKEFPNPNRIGCPGVDVLKKIASHEMPLSDAGKWLDHLGSCSPCFSDFSQFRATYQRQRTRAILAVAASILIVACITGWALFLRQKGPLGTETAVLDLRNRSVPRGPESNPAELPLEVSPSARRWDIVLPLGTREGAYDVRVVVPSGETLWSTNGTAVLKDHLTLLEVRVDVSLRHPGRYLLQIREPGAAWASYSMVLR